MDAVDIAYTVSSPDSEVFTPGKDADVKYRLKRKSKYKNIFKTFLNFVSIILNIQILKYY